MQAEREALRAEDIQEAAIVESQLEAQLKEKLVAAHHTPPARRRKVIRPRTKAVGPTATTAKGESDAHTIIADGC